MWVKTPVKKKRIEIFKECGSLKIILSFLGSRCVHLYYYCTIRLLKCHISVNQNISNIQKIEVYFISHKLTQKSQWMKAKHMDFLCSLVLLYSYLPPSVTHLGACPPRVPLMETGSQDLTSYFRKDIWKLRHDCQPFVPLGNGETFRRWG
jgi:hypothetical protein